MDSLLHIFSFTPPYNRMRQSTYIGISLFCIFFSVIAVMLIFASIFLPIFDIDSSSSNNISFFSLSNINILMYIPIALLVVLLVATGKRLNDVGMHPAWAIFMVVSPINLGLMLFLFIKESKKEIHTSIPTPQTQPMAESQPMPAQTEVLPTTKQTPEEIPSMSENLPGETPKWTTEK